MESRASGAAGRCFLTELYPLVPVMWENILRAEEICLLMEPLPPNDTKIKQEKIKTTTS